MGAARKAAAALGLVSAIGAYGGFLVPQALGLSISLRGSYTPAFCIFVAFYVALMAVTWFCYVRRGTEFANQGV